MSQETLADDLAEQLLQDVIDGRHRPDAPLPPEADIAEEAGVSRLTAREAVKTLAREERGADRARPRHVREPAEPLDRLVGARARRDQWVGRPADGVVARRLIEARRVIEVGAAELAAARRGDADLEALEATLGDMRAAAAAGDVDSPS